MYDSKRVHYFIVNYRVYGIHRCMYNIRKTTHVTIKKVHVRVE